MANIYVENEEKIKAISKAKNVDWGVALDMFNAEAGVKREDHFDEAREFLASKRPKK